MNKKGFTILEYVVILGIIVTFVLSIGFFNNIIKLCNLDFKAPYKAEIIRALGIPLYLVGGVIGFMEISDE